MIWSIKKKPIASSSFLKNLFYPDKVYVFKALKVNWLKNQTVGFLCCLSPFSPATLSGLEKQHPNTTLKH
jgi:hypothetical protein